jgi:type IV pilus assembly protein PilM
MKTTPGVHALLYSGDLLAVDLGTFAVKVLTLKARERSLTVLSCARREVWRELVEAKSDAEKAEVYENALRELLKGRPRVRNASISLPGSAIVLRFLTLPEGGELTTEKGLSAEARALIPFEETDPAVSTLVTPPAAVKDGKPGRPEAVLAAAQKRSVTDAMAVVRKAGLRPAVIVNDVLAYANAHEFFAGPRLQETVMLVNVGATSTSAGVIENGIPRTARVFNIAGNAFTRAVKREFSVDLEEAEKLKRAHGLEVPFSAAPEEKAVAARVASALGPSVKDLAAEILRTADVYTARRPAGAAPIARLLLAGGSAELKGLAEALASAAGLEVELFRPMVNVPGKDGAMGITSLEPDYAVSCGLALSNTILRRTTRPRINLVPRRARRAAILRDMSPEFGRRIAVPALLVLALCGYGWYAAEVSRKEAAIERKLQAAAAAEQASRAKAAAKKKPAPVAVKKPVDPYAYLGRLTVSGVFGSGSGATVMLGNFTARDGRLYDGQDKAVSGVSAEIGDKSVRLEAGGKRYVIALPK